MSMVFKFTDDCIVGVEQIDNDHRHLFDLINEGFDLLNNEYKDDRYEEIKELLEELENYAEQHFRREEAYMKQIRDPELILQRSQHLYFEEKIEEFLVQNIDEEENQIEVLGEIMRFLAKWLYQHILSSDSLIGKLPPLEEWMVKDNPCEFSEEYMTGIDMLDREHRLLFEITERAYTQVRFGESEKKLDEIMEILQELKEYTQSHFADEEEYMRSINYVGLEEQKRAHAAFIGKLEEIGKQPIKDDPQKYLESLIQFLLGWLINHILHSDKKIPKEG